MKYIRLRSSAIVGPLSEGIATLLTELKESLKPNHKKKTREILKEMEE